MDRYRSYAEKDDKSKPVGDGAFVGVDEYNAAENIRPGNVQKAVNHDFTAQDANTRGGFVCIPDLGNSAFGQRWDSSTAGTEDLYDVSYGQGLFVAVGNNGIIQTSPDGITWTTRTSPLAANWTDIVFANSLFLVVGRPLVAGNNVVIRSSDGINWSLTATRPAIASGSTGIGYGNGKWIVVGNSRSSVSLDNGDTWTNYSGILDLFLCNGVSFTNGLFVATTVFGVASSPDGASWTSVVIDTIGLPQDVCFYNSKFFLLSWSGDVWSSSDAITWTQESPNILGSLFYGITAGDGYAVTVGYNSSSGEGYVLTSIDGTSWIRSSISLTDDIRGLTFGAGKIVAVGDGGQVRYSSSIYPSVFASGIYSDPLEKDRPWIMAVATDKVGFFAFGKASKTVSLGSYRVTSQATIVQANNEVYLFRGETDTPLRWNGSWDSPFELVPATTLPSSFSSIPNSNQATFYQNRLWVRDGKDSIAASDVLAFTDFDPQANEFNLNTGNSDYVVATFPFGTNTLIVFKNKSIIALNNVEGSLLDVTATEITRQVGLIGINAMTSVGPDLAYVSYGNINLLTLTTTSNAVQHKILPLSSKIRKIINRVNWNLGYKISLGYWNNKLYVALPLDASPFCNTVVVYNFVTEQWYGEWSFNNDLNMCILGWQVVDYLGLQRLHAVTEDGRIFVTDEGPNDISGTIVCEIATELVTRAYALNEGNHFQRRMYIDVATNRPKFSCYAYTEGAGEETAVLVDQTYSRADSWKFGDTPYDLTNVNNDYNRPYRKDYATGPDSVQCQSGIQPEMTQELRLPLMVRRQGRLSWIKVTNTQGYISVMSVGYETRPGQRSNFVQV